MAFRKKRGKLNFCDKDFDSLCAAHFDDLGRCAGIGNKIIDPFSGNKRRRGICSELGRVDQSDDLFRAFGTKPFKFELEKIIT